MEAVDEQMEGPAFARTGMMFPTGRITTAVLPADMADNDNRGRVVGLSQLAKDWATFPHERERMITTPPR